MTAKYQAFNSVTVWLSITVFLFYINVVWNAVLSIEPSCKLQTSVF